MTVKHIEQPRQTVRVVLPESSSDRVRVSGAAKKEIRRRAAELGCPEWVVIDSALGVKHE